MRETLFPLVFVVGTEESGSRRVERLVAAHPSVWDLGEVDALSRAAAAEEPCGCGTPVERCAFWSRLLAALPPGLDEEAGFAERAERPLVRWRHVLDLVRGTASHEHIARAKRYGAKHLALLERARLHAERIGGAPVRWLVDGSRDPYRLLWLKDSRRFDLRVIHVVRDPRAEVWSGLRETERGGRLKATRHASRWMIENALIGNLLGRGFRREHVLRLRLEDVLAGPESNLERVGAFLGLRYPAWAARAATELPHHALGVARVTPEIEEEWRDALPDGLADTAWRLTRPVRAALGYATR